MYRLTQLVLALTALAVAVQASAVPSRTNTREERLSNAQRLQRGLPPKVPNRLYNATAVRPNLSRRSADANLVYMQATPTTVPGRKRKRGDPTPYDTTSYVYWSTTDSLFYLTTDSTQAAQFQLHGTGSEQYMTYYSSVNNADNYPICTNAYLELGSSYTIEWTHFTLCDSYFETNAKSETYGARFQAQIWTVPSAKTGTLSMTYHNSDGSTTTPNWYAFSVQGANYLGAAAQASDFSSSQTQLLSLSLISSLPE